MIKQKEREEDGIKDWVQTIRKSGKRIGQKLREIDERQRKKADKGNLVKNMQQKKEEGFKEIETEQIMLHTS